MTKTFKMRIVGTKQVISIVLNNLIETLVFNIVIFT